MVVSSISEGASLTLHFLTCGYYGWKEAFGLNFAPSPFHQHRTPEQFHLNVLSPGSFPPSRSSWCGVRVPQVPHITSQLRPPTQPIASMLQQDEKEKHLARFDTQTKDGARRAGLAGAEGVGGGGGEVRALFILSHDICFAEYTLPTSIKTGTLMKYKTVWKKESRSGHPNHRAILKEKVTITVLLGEN
ncbi:hypothetical protein KUCAC02_006551 [Chaenocephalus aceratus]|uniref:Uncharacterized protein n=1 Tax=Chaenocephalus aceratus TaxID=36190 RepID=A0ACB9VSS8_CHAAC|nr:hypothetical protein KUCAC02_006551 [Chaenocephalus aceratus]